MKASSISTLLFLAMTAWLPAQDTKPLDSKDQDTEISGQRLGERLVPGDVINDLDQSAVALHPATPYLEASSLLLADVDLEKIDVTATLQWLHQFAGTPEGSREAETIRGFIDSLKGGGVSHLYLSAATRSPLDGGPLVIIPCRNPAVVQGMATVIVQQLPDDSPQKIHAGEEVVVVGAESAVDRVIARPGVERPDLILPFKQAGLLDHTIVIALPAEAREELSALWPDQLAVPRFPTPISPRQLASDIVRVILSFRLPPEPEMLVRIETADAGAANRVLALIEKAVVLAGDLGPLIQRDLDGTNVNLHATPETFLKVASVLAAPARANATRMARMNDIKQVGLAVHNYYANEKHLPPRVFTDEQGKPLLSWRVAILPYLDQMAMYRGIKLDQSWDSEANKLATSTAIPVYCAQTNLQNKTTIRAPVFPGSLWQGEGPPKVFQDVRDGTSNTILVIDAPPEAAIEWTNPEPWVLSEDDPMSDVFGDRDTAIVGMLDGSARVLSRDQMTNEKLKALLTIDGGEAVESD